MENTGVTGVRIGWYVNDSADWDDVASTGGLRDTFRSAIFAEWNTDLWLMHCLEGTYNDNPTGYQSKVFSFFHYLKTGFPSTYVILGGTPQRSGSYNKSNTNGDLVQRSAMARNGWSFFDPEDYFLDFDTITGAQYESTTDAAHLSSTGFAKYNTVFTDWVDPLNANRFSANSGRFATTGWTINNFYPLNSNPANYLTSAAAGGVQSLNVTGKTVSGVIILTGLGNITLSTGINNTIRISGTNSFTDDGTYVRTTGNQTVSGIKYLQALVLNAGQTGTGTAPFKMTSGSLLTYPETGAIEYDGNQFYYTKNYGIRAPFNNIILSTGLTGFTGIPAGSVSITQSAGGYWRGGSDNSYGIRIIPYYYSGNIKVYSSRYKFGETSDDSNDYFKVLWRWAPVSEAAGYLLYRWHTHTYIWDYPGGSTPLSNVHWVEMQGYASTGYLDMGPTGWNVGNLSTSSWVLSGSSGIVVTERYPNIIGISFTGSTSSGPGSAAGVSSLIVTGLTITGDITLTGSMAFHFIPGLTKKYISAVFFCRWG